MHVAHPSRRAQMRAPQDEVFTGDVSAECVRCREAAESAGGACTIEYLTPVWARTPFMRVRCGEGERPGKIPGDGMSTRSAGQPCFVGGFGDCPLAPHPVVWAEPEEQ